MDLANNRRQVAKINSLLRVIPDNNKIKVDLANNLLLVGLTKVIHVKVDKVKVVHLVMAKVKEIDPEVTQAREECKMVQIKEGHRVEGAKAKEVNKVTLIKVAHKMEVGLKTSKVTRRTQVQLKLPTVANSLRLLQEFFNKQLL
jgi:hypothetical protein